MTGVAGLDAFQHVSNLGQTTSEAKAGVFAHPSDTGGEHVAAVVEATAEAYGLLCQRACDSRQSSPEVRLLAQPLRPTVSTTQGSFVPMPEPPPRIPPMQLRRRCIRSANEIAVFQANLVWCITTASSARSPPLITSRTRTSPTATRAQRPFGSSTTVRSTR